MGAEVLIGPETLDDAGVYRLSGDLALVQTVDFFTPIVDDAADYGRIAAANSLSDVYAMGGRPISALNVLGFPDGDVDEEVLANILIGAREVCDEAGVAILGGHSISDQEMKFGLAVTGTVHPDKILSNANAQPGDVLVLTKALGTGLISNAMMNDAAEDSIIATSVASMRRLNKRASEAALEADAHAATDVTGFGLLGHGSEMAIGSKVTITICADALPLLPGALEIAKTGSFYSGGERHNLTHVEPRLQVERDMPPELLRIATDPQTSGGLIVSLPAENADRMVDSLREQGETAWKIGFVEREKSDGAIRYIRGTFEECYTAASERSSL